MATNFYQNNILQLAGNADLVDATFSSSNTLYFHFNSADNTTDFDAIFAAVKYFYVPVDDATSAGDSIAGASQIQSAGVVGSGLPNFKTGCDHLALVKKIVNWYVTNKTSVAVPATNLEDLTVTPIRDAINAADTYLEETTWASLFSVAGQDNGNFTAAMLEDIIEELASKDKLLNTADSATGVVLSASQMTDGSVLRIHMTYDIAITFSNTSDPTQGEDNDDGTDASHRWYNKTHQFTQGNDATGAAIVLGSATQDNSSTPASGQMNHMRFRKCYQVTGLGASGSEE